MRIRILLLIKVMGICYHWSIDPLSLQGSIVSVNGPPLLYFELLKFLNVGNNADPDTAFHSEADPDPASKINADPDPQHCKKTHLRSNNMKL
jgi:hypothetical protein